MEKIIEAIPMEDYQVMVTTESGLQGIFDVKPYLHGPAFHELKNPAYFNMVRPVKWGIRWPREQDFSSDTIIYDMQNVQDVNGVNVVSE